MSEGLKLEFKRFLPSPYFSHFFLSYQNESKKRGLLTSLNSRSCKEGQSVKISLFYKCIKLSFCSPCERRSIQACCRYVILEHNFKDPVVEDGIHVNFQNCTQLQWMFFEDLKDIYSYAVIHWNFISCFSHLGRSLRFSQNSL